MDHRDWVHRGVTTHGWVPIRAKERHNPADDGKVGHVFRVSITVHATILRKQNAAA